MRNFYFLFLLIFSISLTLVGQTKQTIEKNDYRESLIDSHFKGKRKGFYKSNRPMLFKNKNVSKGLGLKFAQDNKKQRLDSVIIKEWDKNSSQWYISQKGQYIYDVNENMVQCIYYEWDENLGKWINNNYNEKIEYTYDSNDNITQYIEWYYSSNEWILDDKHEFTYDTNSNITQYFEYGWKSSVNQWVRRYKDDYSYNSNGDEIKRSLYEWNTNTNQWIADRQQNYTYDANHNLTLILVSSWNTSSDQWEDAYKEENIYDSKGNITENSLYEWRTYNNQWKKFDKSEYIYDINENLVQEIDYDWNENTNQWGNNYSLKISYDNAYTPSDLIVPPDFYLSSEFDTRIYFKHMIISSVRSDWNESLNEWAISDKGDYFYSDVSPSNNICENLSITNATYPETDDLNQKVKDEFGEEYAIADWNDIKNMENLNDWVNCMGLKHDDTFMVTRDGNNIYSGNRQYFVHYSTDGVPYSGFAVHDKVGDFYLGSWYGINMNIFAKNGGSLAIEDIQDKSFNIFPNPVSDILTIDSKLQLNKVGIYSILGKKIKEINTNFNSISTSDLSSGIYLLRIESEKGVIVKKLIKQ